MRVAVVGAGITGLALTHHLAERGIDSVTYEADNQPGGVIRSETIDGRTVEVGPQRLRLTPGVEDLVEAVGLSDAVVEAGEEHLFVYADGRLREAPLDREAFLRTDLLSWRGKLRLLAEPLTRDGMREESAAELFTRKFGRQAYERFIGPLYGGIYGSDPAEMPATFALDGLLKREQETGSFLRAFLKRVGQGQQSPPISFEAGNQQLPNGLAEAYADRIELGTAVTDVRPAAGDAGTDRQPAAATDGGGQYVVETDSGAETFDHVVVTTPAGVTADILDGVATGTEGLANLTYNPLAMVHLDADCEQEGFGYQVAYGEDIHTLGASWNDSMFDRENLYTVFLGGMHEPDIVDRPDEEIGAIAAEEFEQVMGSPAEVLNVATREKWFPAYDRSWYALEAFEAPPGVHLATNYTARMGIPSRVREARELAEELAAGA
ncbi:MULTISPECIES: protoporphyrinogen oxidase [Salinibaculum]|uniref:protoporphyrinogen oxidase n=1 Tax=Salinibaculum TaxID=2732368 RepID=UPI0030CF1A80